MKFPNQSCDFRLADGDIKWTAFVKYCIRPALALVKRSVLPWCNEKPMSSKKTFSIKMIYVCRKIFLQTSTLRLVLRKR